MEVSKQQKQVVILYASTILGTLLGVLNSVLNTRALPPELFGDVRYVQNIIFFVSSFLLLGYFISGSRLLALSKDEQYSRRIRGAMCAILAATIAVVMLSMAIMYFFKGFKGEGPQMSILYLIAIPFCGYRLMLDYLNTTAQGDNHIGRIAAARLFPAGLYCVSAYLIYSHFGATPKLMLLLNNGISFTVLFIIIITTRPSFKKLKESFALLNEENKRYGLNVYIGSLANVSTGYVAGITLSAFCENNANVGFYSLAITMAMPLALLPSIIGTTYFRRFASENQISSKILKASIGLTIGTCIVFILLIKTIVALLYNDSYQVVAEYSSWLVFGTCMHGLGDMFNRFLGAHGQGRQIRNAAFACGFVLLTGSILLVYLLDIQGAIITKILSSSVYLFTMCYYYIRYVRDNNQRIVNDNPS